MTFGFKLFIDWNHLPLKEGGGGGGGVAECDYLYGWIKNCSH